MRVIVEFRMRRIRGPATAAKESRCALELPDGDALALIEGRRVDIKTRWQLTARMDREALARGYDWAEVIRVRRWVGDDDLDGGGAQEGVGGVRGGGRAAAGAGDAGTGAGGAPDGA